MNRPVYQHVVVECHRCAKHRLNDRRVVRAALRLAAQACDLHVLQEGMHRFSPHGITGYVLLTESHISIHTWPEYEFAVVDVMSCSTLDIAALRHVLKAHLLADGIRVFSWRRPPVRKAAKKPDRSVRSRRRARSTTERRRSSERLQR